MDRLSQEVVCCIADFLPDEHLAAYATISRPWQHAVERRTFRSIRLQSPDLATFDRFFCRDRRRFVRRLAYTVVLPLCSLPDAPCSSSDVDAAFSHAISGLFAIVAAWDHKDAGQTLNLEIKAACSAASHNHNVDAAQSTPVLKLLPSVTLKSVPRVTAVDFARRQWYRIDGTAACRICASLPDLLDATLLINDDPALPPVVRRQTRQDIAQAMESLPRSLSWLYIDAPDCTPLNEDFCPPRLDSQADSLSLALHRLSLFESIANIRIVGGLPISPALFWPAHYDEPGASLPTWPNLQKLTISFSLVAPSGEWYVSGPSSSNAPPPPDESTDAESDDTDDENDADAAATTSLVSMGMHPTKSFRSVTVPELANPLFLAIARAASRMPQLKYMEASARLRSGKGTPTLATIFAVPKMRHYFDKVCSGPKANFKTTRVYLSVPGMEDRLDSRIQRAWEENTKVDAVNIVPTIR